MGSSHKKKAGLGRRDFLKAAALAAAATSCAGRKPGRSCPAPPRTFLVKKKRPPLAELTGGRPPNLLLVLTDQERWEGNLPGTLRRPHFERLKGSAVCFENAFCAYPLCSPSRSAIFSGLYPHQTGVLQNMIFPVGRAPLPKDRPHLGAVLASAGYRIGYKGKWDLSRGPTYYLMNISDRGRAGDYGYEGHCGKVPDQEYAYKADRQVVKEACDWLKAQDRRRPWFLCCSIIDPHDICHPQLKPDPSIRPDVKLPESLHDTLENKPADQKKRRDSRLAHFNQVLNPKVKPFFEYEEEDWKRFLSFYYDLIEGTDEYLGRLFATLEDTGFLEDTIIIYTSDHGELGGAHGFSGKYEGYEEDLHVPLYIHHPGLAKAKVEALVSNVSIAPTIAALAGVEWPGPTAGQDLTPWLTRGSGPSPEALFAESETVVNAGLYRVNMAMRMIRTRRWKCSYSFFEVQDGQLYDLENDPHEMNNLFHEPGYSGVRKELLSALRGWQKETGDHLELPRKLL